MLDAVLALNGLDTRVFDTSGVDTTPHEASDSITVPDAHLLFTGEFKRVGTSDLKIVGSDGNSFFIENYFSAEKHKHLMSPDGALLTSNIVDALAGPLAPGQHAQAGAQPATSQAVIGRVEVATGSCTVVRNGVTVVVNAGDNVRKGDVVVTSSASAIAIVFTDGSTFSLSANARMVLDEFVYAEGGANNTATISLVQGTFSFLAGQVAKTGNMKVETPVATMGIRGTAIGGEVSAIDGTLRDARVMPETDDNGNVIVGSFQLLHKITGQLLATVNSTSVSWVVTPSGPQQVTVTQTARSPSEIQQDATAVQQLVGFYNSYQANPIQPNLPDQPPDQQKNDTPGKQGSTGSGGGTGSGDPPPTTGQQTNTTVTIKVVDIGTVPGITGANGGAAGGAAGGPGPTAGPQTSSDGGVPTATVTVINGAGVILGTPGQDLIFGSAGADVITALAGNDQVYAGGGDDIIIAGEGAGDDFYDGGTGFDTIKFESANGVVFNLNIGTRVIKDEAGNNISVSVSTADGAATGHDEFVRIEKIVGSPGNDVFIINQPINWEIDGGAGVDIVRIAGALDLTSANVRPLASNIEILDLNQNFANAIQLNAADIVTANSSGVLRLLGGTTDVVSLTSTYQVAGQGPLHIGTWQLVGTIVDPSADNGAGDPFNDHVTDGVTFDVYQFVSDGQVVSTIYIQDGMQINVVAGQTNAVNDTAAMTENQTIAVDVVSNDAPGFDTTRTLTSVGSATISGPDGVSLGSPQFAIVNNQLSIVPGAAFDALAEGQTATITVPYTMQIGSGQTLNAVATITVTGTNDAPFFSSLDGYSRTATEDGGPVSFNLLANAADTDTQDTLSAINIASSGVDGEGQTVNVSGAVSVVGSNVTVDPAFFNSLGAGESVTVTVNYDLSDGHTTTHNTATLVVTGANDGPYFSSQEGFNRTASEDDAAVTFNLLNNAVDPEGDALSVANVATSAVNGQGGTVDVSGAVSVDGNNVTINPNFFNSLAADQSVTISVNYDVTDGQATTHNTATLVVTGVNDAPHANDVVLVVNALGNGGFGLSPDFVGWQVNTATSGLSETYYSTATIDRSGTIFVGDDAVAVLNFSGYVPEAGAAGSGPSITSDTFTGYAGSTIKFVYQLSAGTDSGSGDLGTVTGYIIDANTGEIVQQIYNSAPLGSSTGPQTVNVQLQESGEFKIVFVVGSIDSTQGHVVGAQLDLGFAGIIQNGISEDTTYTFAASNFLDTATDAEGDALTIGIVTTSAMGAIVTLNPDGTVTYDPTHAVQIQALAGGETATDTFTFSVTDSHGAVSNLATATVTVLGVDEAQVANAAPVVDTSPTITMVSVPDELPAGTNPNAVNAIAPAVSNDGRYVVFFSTLELPDNNDNNDSQLHGDVFLYDRETGTTTTLTDLAHISERPLGEFYVGFSITGDGSYVVFEGEREVTDNFGTHNESQVYVYDREANVTELLVNPDTDEPYRADGTPRISSGGLITFVIPSSFSDGSGFTPQQIVVTNLNGNVLAHIEASDLNIEAQNISLENPDISGNGRYVTFWGVEHSANLAGPGDASGIATLYSYDRVYGTFTEIATTDAAADDDQWWASMSEDGQFVVFQSNVPRDESDTNNASDIYVWDRSTGDIVGITLPEDAIADGGSIRPSISSNGRYITFASDATNLVSDDTNGLPDTFIYDRETNTFERVSVAHDGTQGNGDSSFASDVNGGGRIVVFSGTSSNLVPGDNNDASDVFIVDRSGGTAGVVGEDASVGYGYTVSTHGAFAFSDANLTDTHLVHVTGIHVNAAGFTGQPGDIGAFTASVVENPNDADPNGQIAWTFDVNNSLLQELGAGQRIVQTYTVEIDDQHGGTVSQNVTVTMTGRNDAPAIGAATAAGEVGAGGEDEANGSIAFSDVDLTDTHNVSSSFNAGLSDNLTPLGVLTATLVHDNSSPADGLVSWHYDIDPEVLNGLAPGSTQYEVFNVKVDDGHGGTVIQQVTITLNGPEIPPENVAPVADAVSASGNEDQSNRIEITLTGSDPGGSVTGFQLLSLPDDGWLYTDFSSSTPIVSGDLANILSAYPAGSLTLYFKPDANWNGEANFQFVAIDNQNAQSVDPATATITVHAENDAPSANDIGVSTSADNSSIPVILSGSDIDGTIAGFQLSSLPADGTLYEDAEHQFAVTIGQNYVANSEGHVTFYFVPNAEWPLLTTFDFIAYDNLGAPSEAPGHVSITADPGNAAPVISFDNVIAYGGEETTTVHGLSVTDPDADTDEIFHVTVTAGHGSLSLAEGNSGIVDEDGSAGGMSFDATQDQINLALLQGVTYTVPEDGQEGLTDTVTVTVEDAHGASDSINFRFSVFGDGGATLTGADGKDMLFSTGNNDVLTGGGGADIFVFTNEYGGPQNGFHSGDDIITDFAQGVDKIALVGFFEDYDQFLLAQAGNSDPNLIILGNGSSITLNVPVGSLQETDFILHSGPLAA